MCLRFTQMKFQNYGWKAIIANALIENMKIRLKSKMVKEEMED